MSLFSQITGSAIEIAAPKVLVVYQDFTGPKSNTWPAPALRTLAVARKLSQPNAIRDRLDDREHRRQIFVLGPRTNFCLIEHCGRVQVSNVLRKAHKLKKRPNHFLPFRAEPDRAVNALVVRTDADPGARLQR